MTYESCSIQELILATLRLHGNGQYKTYLSVTLIKNFFPEIQSLDETTVEKALKVLLQKRILRYTKVRDSKKNAGCFYKIRIDNLSYVYSRHSSSLIQATKTISEIPALRLFVNFPPGALNAELNILVGTSNKITNYKPPIKITREKSEAWKQFSLHQKEKILIASIIGKKYYKSGSEYVSKIICGGKRRNGIKSERISWIFLQGFNLDNEQYVIANFSPTTQELLANQKLALKSEQDIQTLVEDIARFCK